MKIERINQILSKRRVIGFCLFLILLAFLSGCSDVEPETKSYHRSLTVTTSCSDGVVCYGVLGYGGYSLSCFKDEADLIAKYC